MTVPDDERDDLSQITTLVHELAEIAPWWSGFWEPLPEQAIASFEATHRIALPGDFRRLLLEVGDRAPLPSQARGGFLPLHEALELRTADSFLGPLCESFPYSGKSDVTLSWNEELDDYEESPPLRGLLPIGDGGCDVSYHLVISGVDRGRVWTFAPSGAPELHPTGQDLLAWYRTRLDKSMQPLRQDAQEERRWAQRVSADASDIPAALRLGRRRLLLARNEATELIERSWLNRHQLSDEEQLLCLRAVAELDLLDGRSDRIAGMQVSEDPWLRCYAGIAAARDQRWNEAEHLLASGTPSALRAIGAIYRGRAAMNRGNDAEAIEILRKGPVSPYTYHLLAQAYARVDNRDQALRAHRLCLSGHARHPHWQPHKPTMTEQLMPALPSVAEIQDAIAALIRR